ncbi:metal-dependent transcriptional regulator [Archaeoglobus veneficus]|uniref:Iron (Metal) dependent repressor, DtxR family n=1 Tax=Archaeoglobus veneficus (strain DSM 11195 / SNP6) TaxID=693661 RepID=F2KQ59_ARCVS|nr:metal-dependent transcriptional regulator [Archaeoglobus veneficus]AEA47662.1 iron (metal) dependent repressor, DtxR family [Archaeoglobus veneficus SNP6]
MERVEEYLEAIYDIQSEKKRAAKTSDLAKKLSVRPSSVTEMLSKLSEKGYVEYQPYRGAILTRKGEEVARRIKRYHRIFEAFFRDFLGIDESEAHRISCELEHHVTDEIVEKVCEIIASSCSLCESCEYRIVRLSEAEPGRYVVVACPSAASAIGIFPDVEIIVGEGGEVEIEGESVRLSEKLASKIILERR